LIAWFGASAGSTSLGGTIFLLAHHVPGTSFGVLADAHGHGMGVASNG
jgi:hypothetical protein